MNGKTAYKITALFFLLVAVASYNNLEHGFRSPHTIQSNILTVTFELLGATPEHLEYEVTAPLENTLSSLANITKISSVSKLNRGMIEIEFDKNSSMSVNRLEVNKLIRDIYIRLNSRIAYPQITEGPSSHELEEFLIYSIQATQPDEEIYDIVSRVFLNNLGASKFVNQVEIRGRNLERIFVEYDEQKLSLLGLNADDVADAIALSTSTFLSGAVANRHEKSHPIRIQRQVESLNQLDSVMLTSAAGSVLLHDIAKIYATKMDNETIFKVNGANSIIMVIKPSAFASLGKIKDYVHELSQLLPEGYEIHLEHDEHQDAASNAKRAIVALVITLSIFMFLTALFSSIKHAIVFSTSLVGVISVSMFLYNLRHKGIDSNQISMAIIATAIASGNIFASIRALSLQKNLLPTLLSSLTWLIILLTTYTITHVLFDKYDYVLNAAIFLIVVEICSVLTCYFYTPAVYYLLYPTSDITAGPLSRFRVPSLIATIKIIHYRALSLLQRHKVKLTISIILIFGTPIFLFELKPTAGQLSKVTQSVKGYSDIIFGGTLRLFAKSLGRQSTPIQRTRSRIDIRAILGKGYTIADMNNTIGQMELFLNSRPEVERFFTEIISGQYASIKVYLKKEYELGQLPIVLKDRIIGKCMDWSGALWDVSGIGDAFTTGTVDATRNYKIIIRGFDYELLEDIANKFGSFLQQNGRVQLLNTNAELLWTESPSEEHVLQFDQELYSQFGINSSEVISSVHSKTLNAPSGFVLNNMRRTPVITRSATSIDKSMHDILNEIYISNSKTFRLNAFSSITKVKSANAIHKENREYLRGVSFHYVGDEHFGDIHLQRCMESIVPSLPNGVTIEVVGHEQDRNDEEMTIRYLIVFSLLALYTISAVSLNTLDRAFVVILSIPAVLSGLFLGIYTFRPAQFDGVLLAIAFTTAITCYLTLHVLLRTNPETGSSSESDTLKLRKDIFICISIIISAAVLLSITSVFDFWNSFAISLLSASISLLIWLLFLLPVYCRKFQSSTVQ